ncbi:unnamed protein product [Didymodactylos carnosus]|uniref:Enoyl-[acyl-carrier-protein] reductase, mitochondrial n=1 Tax=Didymodactylos carnosus TaxID=1234261 RepID=A0A813PII8_9BILA|nr:unnamed protein product [Didymodactylos carnosus]CAF0851021.1 unnamed protein product [Didymodactylos carnosus]CAF3536031.1 unnamed protein product [Didymodactylos carnosus]CAF3636241.1 unnamed protein product [Didymodactylos carnosus]
MKISSSSHYISKFSLFHQIRRALSSYTVHELQSDQYGAPLEVLKLNKTQTIDGNQLKANESIVKLIASPINPADINMIQGKYAILPKSFPATFGNEGVFEIVETNVKAGLKPGDWVIPKVLEWGKWRSYGILAENDLMYIPKKDLMPEAVATLSVNPCTAVRLIKDFVQLEKGDTIIQNGGNSAVGLAVIQLGKLWGFNVVSIVRQRENLQELVDYMKSIGGEHVYVEEDLRKAILLTDLWKKIPRPKLGLNCVGGRATIDLLRILAKSGTMVTYGGMSKQPITVPTSEFIFKNLTCKGFWLSRWKTDNMKNNEYQKMLHELIGYIKQGHLKPPQCQLFKLEDYAKAIEASEQRFSTKKVLFIS